MCGTGAGEEPVGHGELPPEQPQQGGTAQDYNILIMKILAGDNFNTNSTFTNNRFQHVKTTQRNFVESV